MKHFKLQFIVNFLFWRGKLSRKNPNLVSLKTESHSKYHGLLHMAAKRQATIINHFRPLPISKCRLKFHFQDDLA